MYPILDSCPVIEGTIAADHMHALTRSVPNKEAPYPGWLKSLHMQQLWLQNSKHWLTSSYLPTGIGSLVLSHQLSVSTCVNSDFWMGLTDPQASLSKDPTLAQTMYLQKLGMWHLLKNDEHIQWCCQDYSYTLRKQIRIDSLSVRWFLLHS